MTLINRRGNMNNIYDVVIIGAGPAGLFCGYQLCENIDARILIIDKGEKLSKRICSANQKGKCKNCNPCNISSGIGGSGFHTEGKLSLSENVGELLQEYLYDCGFDSRMIRLIDNILLDEGTVKPTSKSYLNELRSSLQKVGLDLEHYPVRSFLHGREIVESMISFLRENKIDVLHRTEAINISKNRNGMFIIDIINNGILKRIETKFLVIGPGKSGVKWLLEQSNLIGLHKVKNPLYVGIRVEVRNHVVNKLAKVSHNPKIIKFKGDTYVKTHCFCEGGVVVKGKFEDVFLVDGYPVFDKKLENTNFTVFTKLIPPSDFNSTFDFANEILSYFINRNDRNVILQRLGDLRKAIPSTKTNIENNSVKPTLEDYQLDDINKFLPKEIIESSLYFLNDLNKICPGINADSTLVYAPVIEWWGDRILVNKYMESSLENLYVIGDGSGWTQGIIPASATGLIAAASIMEKYLETCCIITN